MSEPMSEPWKDPIIEELREVRRQLLRECGNDFNKLRERFVEAEKLHADRVVTRKPVPLRKSKPSP